MKETIIYRNDHQGGGNMNAARGDDRYARPQPEEQQRDYVMRDALQESIGHYIIAEHLVGTNEMETKEGLLVRVESNFYVLYDEDTDTYQACDYYSLKFFRRLPPGQRPPHIQPRNARR